jgi:hypothetical protein
LAVHDLRFLVTSLFSLPVCDVCIFWLRRGVVAYEGDMLLQAVHDDVEITLLKDVIEDTPEPSPRRRIPVRGCRLPAPSRCRATDHHSFMMIRCRLDSRRASLC